MSEPIKGFVGDGPDPWRFAPTPQEQEKLRQLLEWQNASARCTMIFGPSINCPKCGVENNPNNTICRECRTSLAPTDASAIQLAKEVAG